MDAAYLGFAQRTGAEQLFSECFRRESFDTLDGERPAE